MAGQSAGGADSGFGQTVNLPAMKGNLPAAAVERLPRYLRCLELLPPSQVTISSKELARLCNLNAAGVRKDLSYLGSAGMRGVGYCVKELVERIRRRLGLTENRAVAVIGVGNLGSALANHGGFGNRGFRIAGLYDADPAKIGRQTAGITIRPLEQLPEDAESAGISVGIIATPAEVAQKVADTLSEAGVPSILNFAPAVLSVPEGVHLRQVDVATELQILGFYMTGR